MIGGFFFGTSFDLRITGALGFNFGQSSSQTITSSSASVTTMNGVPGGITSRTVRPFLTGLIPVVGIYPSIPAAGQAAAEQSGQRMARIRDSRAAANYERLQRLLQRIERAEQQGNKRMARANYRTAIAIAPEPLRTELRRRMNAMLRSSRKRAEN